jgi:2-keto-3-deoxy-L-rhamnonate aldolase RhmA
MLRRCLEAGETVSLLTLVQPDPVGRIDVLSASEPCAVILDSAAHAPQALRTAVARARVAHVDALVKTSRRAGIAELLDLPATGLVVADCEEAALGQLAAGLEGRDAPRPFVIAVIETMAGLKCVEAIARSPWIDALMVGPRDLSEAARLSGANAGAVLARASERVRTVAARFGKVWAVVTETDAQAKEASHRGARLLVRGTDETTLSAGVAAYAHRLVESVHHFLPGRQSVEANRDAG